MIRAKEVVKCLLSIPLRLTGWYVSLTRRFSNTVLALHVDDLRTKLSDRTTISRTAPLPLGSNASTRLTFTTPTALTIYRARTFSSKEPETLEWIERFGEENGVLFDVGANVGIFSLYFSQLFRAPSYAFEPNPFNLPLLAENIHLNALEHLVNMVPVALSSYTTISDLTLSTTLPGGALATFEESYGPDGKPLNPAATIRTLGLSLDSLVGSKTVEEPSLIKIDVDGIEHLVLSGMKNTLRSSKLKSVLIEVDDSFEQAQKDIRVLLEDAGFKLEGKYHADMFDDGPWNSSFNQIWIRST